MGTKRQEKFSRMIQKELAEIFQRESGSWIKGNIVSVTKVEMSPDLSVATVYLSFVMKDVDRVAFAKINGHKSEVRKNLGNRIGKIVRIVPELVFVFDEGAANAERMDEIFRNLHIPPQSTED